jgi:ATP-dependent helicase/nuclease subunit B
VQSIGGVPELPAALLQDFEWCEDEESEVALDPRWLAQRAGAGLESVDDEQAPVVSSEEVNVVGGGSGLLEDQSHCPFRAFAKRRLKLEPLGEFHVGLSASARGSILHDALYVLWGHLGDSNALASIDVEALDQLIGESANSALQALPTRQLVGLGQGYLALEGQRLQALLGEWVQIERQRSEFIVLAREQDVSLTLGPLEIKLRADRIDQLADGSQFIIDYKSGRSDVKDWLGDRPAKPQLLLYCMASGQEPNSSDVSSLGFAQVRPGDSGYIGAGRVDAAPGIRTDIVKLVGEESQVEDWQDLNVVWWETLQRLVDNFVAGDAEVDPKGASSCSYCGLDSLCRIGDDREAST